MSLLESFSDYFMPTYSNFPHGRYVTLVVARWIESEAIFRTEGSGEPLNKEFVFPGLQEAEPIQRVIISKRKQTAVERRTGRELLRRLNLLYEGSDGICALNRNNPCERCLDCMIYGYAAGGGGAQKSRVITDDAFSLHPVHQIVGTRTFNAPFDNSSPWDRGAEKQMTGLGEDEYVKPQAVFLDMETLKDLTMAEFQYVLGNILRSSRYGAISSRLGKIHNALLGVIFSDCELFSNLELVQATYDLLGNDGQELDFPLPKEQVHAAANEATTQLMDRVVGHMVALTPEELSTLHHELTDFYRNEDTVQGLFKETSQIYIPQ